MPTRQNTAIFCVFIAILVACPVTASDDAIAVLQQGVDKIGISGSPGPVCVFGDTAFPVITGSQKDTQVALVAAAEYGKGRAVAFGHNGYLNPSTLQQFDTLAFFKNCIRWASRKKNDPAVGVYRNNKLTAFLKERNLSVDNTDMTTLEGIDVLVLAAGQINSNNISQLDAYVSDGGALITAGLGWGWKQLNPGKSLANDFAANQLLAPMGLVWADGTAEKTSPEGYLVGPFESKWLNASMAFDAALAHSKSPKSNTIPAAQTAATLTLAIRNLPDNDAVLLPKIQQLEKQYSDKLIILPNKPLASNDILNRLFVTQQVFDTQKYPPEKITAHPAAEVFPGSVPIDAPRVDRMLDIDTSIPRWHSTGLYAAAGEIITVQVDAAAVNKKLSVRIGAHKDKIWRHDKWKRFPEVTRTFGLKQTETTAANAFGGPVYIEVPKNCTLGTIKVNISGAVEAPYYVHGKTDLKAWRQTIRDYPAPWAELASDRVILTVPSANIRELDDPAALMDLWNEILDACADLATIDRKRPSPERIVPDVQISAGYMHSGYPIMTYDDQYTKLVDRAHLLTGSWGLFHELGHNHQNRDWTFSGTGEVTVNLFTTYVFDQVCKVPPGEGRVNFEKRQKEYEQYVAKGRDFEQWKSKPFLALVMYLQLQEQFGWDAYKKVFAEYRSLPDDQHPKTDADKRDQWMIRFSKTVGYNLGPFFDAWNIPVSDAAKEQIRDLPAWLPDDLKFTETAVLVK